MECAAAAASDVPMRVIMRRKRELKRRLREVQLSGFKSRNSATFLAMRNASMQLEEQQLKMAAAGSNAEDMVARMDALLQQAGVDVTADKPQNAADAAAAAASDNAAAAADAAGLPANAPTVTVLIKADVQGSAEAVRDAVAAAGEGRVHIKIVYCGVGPISTSDVHLAATTGAKLIAFNLRAPAPEVETQMKTSNIEILQHRVIYHLLDEISSIVDAAAAGGSGQSGSTVEEVLGTATVLQVFPLLKQRKEVGRVAGCRVQEGSLQVNPSVIYRVIRDGEVVYEGPCTSLRQQKQDVTAVGKSNECGVVLDEGKFGGYQTGDVVQCVQQRTQRARSS